MRSLAVFAISVRAALVGTLFAAGCAHPHGDSPPDRCTAAARDATADVMQVVLASRACDADGDCVTVSIGNACFDACTRAIAASKRGDVERAEHDSEVAHCSLFQSRACTIAIPPCAPPPPPRCVDHLCQ